MNLDAYYSSYLVVIPSQASNDPVLYRCSQNHYIFTSVLLFIILTRNTTRRFVFTLHNTSLTQFVTPQGGMGRGADIKGLADKALNKMKKKNKRQ